MRLSPDGTRSSHQYRLELEQVHAELIRIFNEENRDEGSDITCRSEPPTGTRLRQRVCRSSAQMRADADASRAFLNSLLFGAGNRHSAAMATAAAQTEAFIGGAESRATVEQQLQRLQRENDRLYRAVLEYLELEDEYNRAREAGRR